MPWKLVHKIQPLPSAEEHVLSKKPDLMGTRSASTGNFTLQITWILFKQLSHFAVFQNSSFNSYKSDICNLIPHSHQKLSCLKCGVSYSLAEPLPINRE